MSQAEYFATPDLDFSFPTRLGIVHLVAVSPAAVAKGKGVRSAMNPSFGDIYDRYQKLTLTTHLPAVTAGLSAASATIPSAVLCFTPWRRSKWM